MVEKKTGELALKLHTARSRNDQVLFDLKLFCQSQLIETSKLCAGLQMALEEAGEECSGIIIPGYTHMQHAQLVFLSDYFKSYAEMLERDAKRLKNARQGIKLTLGAGALAGVPIKAGLYNEAIKKFLGETKEFAELFNSDPNVTSPKSLDTVSDRDFIVEALSALSILGMHLSRLAEDLIIWSTKEFGFVELDDAFATGSSLMPQKKNPDVLELIRGYTGTLYGNLMNVLTVMKGLPLTYNRDMQLDKPALFSSFEIIEKELKVLPKFIKTLKWNEDGIKSKIEDDETLYATDLVYYLIEKGMAFKKAHDVIGELVKYSFDRDTRIKDMTDETLKQFSNKLKHKEIEKLMVPEVSVKSRISVSGKEKD